MHERRGANTDRFLAGVVGAVTNCAVVGPATLVRNKCGSSFTGDYLGVGGAIWFVPLLRAELLIG